MCEVWLGTACHLVKEMPKDGTQKPLDGMTSHCIDGSSGGIKVCSMNERIPVSSQSTSWYSCVRLTPDIDTLAWAPLNCSGGSPASRTTRAHSPAFGRTRDYSDREICHKPRNTESRGRMDRGTTWSVVEVKVCWRDQKQERAHTRFLQGQIY